MSIINPYKKYKKGTKIKAIKANKPLKCFDPIPVSNSQPSQHVKLSIRLPKGIVTSLTLKKNILALWLLYTADTDVIALETIQSDVQAANSKGIQLFSDKANTLITVFIYKCLEDWRKDTGKGLSDFITEKMIEDLMDDYETYIAIIGVIG